MKHAVVQLVEALRFKKKVASSNLDVVFENISNCDIPSGHTLALWKSHSVGDKCSWYICWLVKTASAQG
jgi:hypothetical protein